MASTEEIREEETKLLLKTAVKVSLLVPSLDKSDALFSVGMDQDQAESSNMKERLRHLHRAHIQRHGQPVLRKDLASLKERASTLLLLMKRDPNDHNKRSLKQTEAMKLVGFKDKDARTGTNEYQQVYRLVKQKRKEIEEAQSTAPAPAVHPHSRPANLVIQQANLPPLLSPLSQTDSEASSGFGHNSSSGSSLARSIQSRVSFSTQSRSVSSNNEGSVEIPDDFTETHYYWPVAYPADWVDRNDKLIPLPRVQKPKSLQSLTMTSNFRNTTEAAHKDCQLLVEGRSIRSSVYKAATVLWQGVQDKENTLKSFSMPEKVADAFNRFSGIELISGNELVTAVERGNVGKSPPRRGRFSSVADEEFHAFCDAVFTLSAIEQVNGLHRLTRSELLSLVGDVLNAKREDEDLEPIGEVNFFRHIEMHNCRKQSSARPDKREAIRVKWLTYQVQKKNYEHWEETAVDLGFARYPRDGEETNGQHIIWHEGQEHRVINFDEMALDLDISNTQAGGRPSHVPTAVGISGEGEAAQKSSEKVTCIFGMTFGGDPLPPYFQFPMKATDPGRYKLQTRLLASFPQIKGKFGFPTERYFDVGFGMNPKGGMNTEALSKYLGEFICPLFPDSDDVPGIRVMAKADNGPGRMNPDLQCHLRAVGWSMFAQTPNGTEKTQECDQVYAYLKMIAYRNRDKLYRARQAANPDDTSPLGLADVGYIVFGGTVALADGTTVELEDAFSKAFDKDHLLRACEKCGYLPSTRAVLKSNRLRHEVVMQVNDSDDDDPDDDDSVLDANGDRIDQEADPIGALYLALEEQNHKACSLLLQKGYKLATKLQRNLRKVGADQVAGRQRVITEPNTRERQDLLMKASTAGQFFHVTNGGGPMNSNDALIAWRRKEMIEEAAELEKKKDELQTFVALNRKALAFLNSRKAKTKWTIPDYKLIIQWKQGASPVAPRNDKLSSLDKKQLVALYESKYKDAPEPSEDDLWTDEMQESLEKLRSGEIEDFFADCGLSRALDRDEEYLKIRLKKMPSSDRKKRLIMACYRSLSQDDRRSLIDDLVVVQDDDDEDDHVESSQHEDDTSNSVSDSSTARD